MVDNPNPQAAQMSDESMVRNLAAQATAVWPQERPLVERYDLPDDARVIDVGCGTGEIAARVAELLPRAHVTGIDLDPAHLDRARARCADVADRVDFRVGNAFELDAADDAFDLVLCRHLLQAVPDAPRLVAELVRVARPGGVVHLVAEDYAMMHFHPVRGDNDLFWHDGPIVFAQKTGSNLRSGRTMFTVLHELGLQDVRVDYVVIDPVRVPRDVFAQIMIAWRDGYADAIDEHSSLSRSRIEAEFADMVAAIESPTGYGVWFLPVVSGQLPAR